MDVDRNSATPIRYGVRGIPTLLVFKGGQVKEQIVGYVAKETIQKAIDKHVQDSVISRQHSAMHVRQYFLSTPITRPCTSTEAAGTMMSCILTMEACRR